MKSYAICPYCGKTIAIERTMNQPCPDCGGSLNFSEMQKGHMIIDTRTESNELESAKSYFTKAEYQAAHDHFKKALTANKNSYSAQYFVCLCNIYLHEKDKNFDVMGTVLDMVELSLAALSRSIVSAADKLAFIKAMLAECKVIITRRLMREDLFAKDIKAFRKAAIADLKTLLDLFKIDRELIMLFSFDVSMALLDIADCAIRGCYKAVQSVVVGTELFTPTDGEYKQLLGLVNDYCFFAQSLNPSFDASRYSPDFSQNYMLNEKVLARFENYDVRYKTAKKYTIANLEEYDSILEECKLAVNFTYMNCYRAMCSRQTKQHARLFFDGIKLLYRLLLPRVVIADKKRTELHACKFVDMADYCDILTRFLVDAFDLNHNIGASLHEFYEKLYGIVDSYIVPGLSQVSKTLNKVKDAHGEDFFLYQRLLFDWAACCAPALKKYVDFSDGSDKTRAKIVKICKEVAEDFLMLCDYRINELEQSNFYRPILQIYAAVTEEAEE